MRVLACDIIELTLKSLKSLDLSIITSLVDFLSKTISFLIGKISLPHSERVRYSLVPPELSFDSQAEFCVNKLCRYWEKLESSITEPFPKRIKEAQLSYLCAKAKWVFIPTQPLT